jgi:hypothetical protein
MMTHFGRRREDRQKKKFSAEGGLQGTLGDGDNDGGTQAMKSLDGWMLMVGPRPW